MTSSPYHEFIGSEVVLDTGGPILYFGTLVEASQGGFVLENAEVHDTRVGHATNETYISQVSRDGVTPNRKRVLVLPAAVLSVSALSDILK